MIITEVSISRNLSEHEAIQCIDKYLARSSMRLPPPL
jgi:hypothetical protein